MRSEWNCLLLLASCWPPSGLQRQHRPAVVWLRVSTHTHAPVELLGQPGRGRLLDDLLVAALHRAVAVKQVHGAAVPVGKHLNGEGGRGWGGVGEGGVG